MAVVLRRSRFGSVRVQPRLLWVETNCRERHLKEDGRILGKIQKGPGEWSWTVIQAGRPRLMLGHRILENEAKELLEREVS